jgi:phospholipid N-methyltransferase
LEPTLFLRHALRRPATVGAFLPSSRHLARAMSAQTRGAQLLVELGAGTGAVTLALRHLHPHVPLVAVEAQPHLAQHLREQFHGIDVRTQWAHEVLDELTVAPAHTVLVSSLPFRSLPAAVRERTVRALCRFLAADPARRLVQYTYQPRVPFDLPLRLDDSRALHWRRVRTVWRNAPPAGVWVLQ